METRRNRVSTSPRLFTSRQYSPARRVVKCSPFSSAVSMRTPVPKGAQIRIQRMDGIIKIAAVEQHLHTPRHLVQPRARAPAAPRAAPARVLRQTQPEPGPHRAGHAALQARRQRAHVQHAHAVHQTVVQDDRLLPALTVPIVTPAHGQKMQRKIAPRALPAGTLVPQTLPARIQSVQINSHVSRPACCCRSSPAETCKCSPLSPPPCAPSPSDPHAPPWPPPSHSWSAVPSASAQAYNSPAFSSSTHDLLLLMRTKNFFSGGFPRTPVTKIFFRGG